MKRILATARREFAVYFDSPIAYIFIILFLVVTVWNFFDRSYFFTHGQATMREFFDFIPVIFIPFIPAITMRLWSEERRLGTDELLLTLPIRPIEAILGKFFAALGLLAIALASTLPLCVTVSYLGPLDWGPVIGSYFGAIFLGAACLALGLFISSMCRNQIVAFIVTVAILYVFFIMGDPNVILRLPGGLVPWVEYLSFSHHYESVARGVLDLRDLFYYLTFVGFFLYLNQAVLAWRRWS